MISRNLGPSVASSAGTVGSTESSAGSGTPEVQDGDGGLGRGQLARPRRPQEAAEEGHPGGQGERHSERRRRSPPHSARGRGQGGLDQHQHQLGAEDAEPVGGQRAEVEVAPAGERGGVGRPGGLGGDGLRRGLAEAPRCHQGPADEPGRRCRAEQPERLRRDRGPARLEQPLHRAHERSPAERTEPQAGQDRPPGAGPAQHRPRPARRR